MKKKYRYVVFGSIIACVIVFLVVFSKNTTNKETLHVSIKDKSYTFQVARTAPAREKGLSGTDTILYDGMIFIFPQSDLYSFWMKEMKYPIDILWVNENFEIVEMRENIYPGTYPEVFTPTQKALYVIEVRAGVAEKADIRVGDQIAF